MQKTQLKETALTKAMKAILKKENARMVVAKTTYSKGEDLAAKDIYERGRYEATMFCIGEIIALFSQEKEDMEKVYEQGQSDGFDALRIGRAMTAACTFFTDTFTQYKTNSNG